MTEFMERVEEIAHDRKVSESHVLEEAIEYGVKELWKKDVLAKYVRGELSREEAIDKVGLELVKKADKELEAVEEDIEWAEAA